MQFVDDALVAAPEDDHEVLDGHGPVPVPRSRRWTGGIAHFLPLEDGRRHCLVHFVIFCLSDAVVVLSQLRFNRRLLFLAFDGSEFSRLASDWSDKDNFALIG